MPLYNLFREKLNGQYKAATKVSPRMPMIERSPLLLRGGNNRPISELTPFGHLSEEDETKLSEMNISDNSSLLMSFFADGLDGSDKDLFEALLETIIDKITLIKDEQNIVSDAFVLY